MSAVLVAGCGYVGATLARRLVEDGERVIGLKRDPSGLPAGVVGYAADLLVPATLEAIPDDVDRVVYAVSAGGRTEAAYVGAYVRGLEHLLALLRRRGVRLARLLFTSSTAVYGQDDGGWVDERSETAPAGFSGRVLLDAEAIVRDSGGTTLRLAGIYGPGRTWLVERVQRGEARIPPGPARYGNRMHRDDCAGALRHLLRREAPLGLYLGVDDAPAPLADVYRFVADLLDAPPPSVGEESGARGGNKRCRNDRLLASGYRLLVPTYREGYPAIVDGYLSRTARGSD